MQLDNYVCANGIIYLCPMILADSWKDYELLDTGNGDKLERWGNIILRRPDPQIIWTIEDENTLWKKADAQYLRSKTGGGEWQFNKKLPERWTIQYKHLKFHVKAMGFKHTGIFPEQAVNWDWMMNKIKNANRPVNVLNLFSYTGAATVACAAASAQVCHVDAAKGIVALAKENLELSGLADKPVRFIVDDVVKFVQREQRRGKQYDAIIMDPPSYGRGANGEVWNIEQSLYALLQDCLKILSPDPLFFLINSYTTGFSPTIMSNLLQKTVHQQYPDGLLSCDEIGLKETRSGLILPCGIFGRWEKK
jgi:23S rRNA (cytosine1962-C5)-methyltransferase